MYGKNAVILLFWQTPVEWTAWNAFRWTYIICKVGNQMWKIGTKHESVNQFDRAAPNFVLRLEFRSGIFHRKENEHPLRDDLFNYLFIQISAVIEYFNVFIIFARGKWILSRYKQGSSSYFV